MDINSLTSGVSALWSFVWPPVVNLMVLILIVRLLAPSISGLISNFIRHRLNSVSHFLKNNEMVTETGMKKLVPGVLVFALVFVLYVSNVMSIATGGLLPGRITYSPTMLISSYPYDENLKIILSKYPNIKNTNDLSGAIEEINRRVKSKGTNLLGYDHWERKTIFYNRIMGYLKFYIAFSIILVIFELSWFSRDRKIVKRFLGLLFTGVCVALFSGYKLIQAYENDAWGKIALAKLNIVMDDTTIAYPDDIEERICEIKNPYGKMRWWWVSL